MKILIAPNAFKGALGAADTAHAIANGLLDSDLDCHVIKIPIADGGDGSLSVIAQHLQAIMQDVVVKDPIGKNVQANFGITPHKKAIIEMAEASGIRRVKKSELDPWKLTSFGTGQLIRSAIDKGCTEIILTLGGSATVDGGLGLLCALGVRFYDSKNEEIVTPSISHMDQITRLDANEAFQLLDGCKISILSDVSNTLLGPEGAASVFGPQKGLLSADIPRMDESLRQLAMLVQNTTQIDCLSVEGGGAAGGIGAILNGLFDAQILSGGEEILRMSGFVNQLIDCDLVVTAEGQIDQQTSYGKGPGLVAMKASQRGIPVIGLSGGVDLYEKKVDFFNAIFPVINGPSTLEQAMKETATNLQRTALQLGNLLAFKGFLKTI